jgi:peptidyl-prolyl cis-trans isomerase SurA
MRSSRRLVTGVVVALGLIGAPVDDAQASIADRIVAVVGERPILLSELRQRARPHLLRMASTSPSPTDQSAAEARIFREVLDGMIDERLEERAAAKARLSATSEEVENGIRRVAEQTKLTPSDVIEEAKKQGLSEEEYRAEIRRQVVEGKLIELRVRGRVQVTELDARAAYARWRKDIAQLEPVDLDILVLPLPAGAGPATVAAHQARAARIVTQARSGTPLCQLAPRYGAAGATPNCGSRGAVPMAALFPQLQEAAKALKPGQTSDPILFGDPMGNTALLIVQLNLAGARIPAYEEVVEQMKERAVGDATERERKAWLRELRRGTVIDVRL